MILGRFDLPHNTMYTIKNILIIGLPVKLFLVVQTLVHDRRQHQVSNLLVGFSKARLIVMTGVIF